MFETAGRSADQLGQYGRHPLALLSEAGDDICYAIIDLEDGCKAGLIGEPDAMEILENLKSGATGSSHMPGADRLSMGRAMVINELVNQCAEVFQTYMTDILDGSFIGSLIDRTPAATDYSAAKKISLQHVFNSERVLELEAAGYKAIQGLMNILVTAALTDSASGFDLHIRKLTNLRIDGEQSIYQKLLACTDKVSGMTDRYCVELFRKLSGHARI
ncbi:MAG: hypothetical protein GY826_31000 [Fuerstiella sp.]|nr:hypothetical protein [Fuerstiella sp.]